MKTTQASDCEHQPSRKSSRLLALSAHVTAAYPLLSLVSLYGQWLLSWRMLGRRPLPSLDDPKYIDGASWMHLVTFVAFIGFLPAFFGAVVLNTRYALERHLRGPRLLLRITIAVALWVSAIVLLNRDPGSVLYWRMD